MKNQVGKVAVVGAGVMGAQIAAHLANAQYSVCLLDIAPTGLAPEERSKGLTLSHPQVRNRIVTKGLESARRSKPPAFFLPECAQLIRLGNLEDDLSWLAEVDWWSRPVARAYWRVLLRERLLCEIYQDLDRGGWFVERIYD